MGVDLSYQGLPAGCGFVELVRSRTWTNPSWIGSVRYWLRWGTNVGGVPVRPGPKQKSPWPDDLDATVLWDWCCNAVGRFPDITERNFDAHQSYRWLPFLLSATVRKRLRWPKPEPIDPRSWNDPEGAFDKVVEQAFNGAPQIAPDVFGSQGLPIRLMSREVVSDFGLCVAAMPADELTPRFSELVSLDLIPAWDEELRAREFAEFQSFFAEAATRGEDVLVIWT
jgi:hypothetical protein